MTRGNCVPPRELTDKHLVAEYRELPRVFGLVRNKSPSDVPPQYVMGTGHVRFFYNKLGYLVKRQQRLIDEMIARGMKPKFTNPQSLVKGIPCQYINDWTPTKRALAVNRARIKERLQHRTAATLKRGS